MAASLERLPLDLKPLTAMRFFAALWVVGFHYWPYLTATAMPDWQAKGYLGVELFFVLSGFILSHVYLEKAGAGRLDYKSFLWARLARIYPLHLVTMVGLGALGIAAMVAGLDAGDRLLVWKSLPGQIFLVQAWGLTPGGGWNHPAWSISAEWFAYLSFPLFAAVAWSLRRRPVLAVGLAGGLVVALNLVFEKLTGQLLTEQTIAWGALRIVPCFAYGCAFYLMFRTHFLTSRFWAQAMAAGSAVAVAIAAALGVPDPVLVLLFGPLIYGLGSLTTAGSKVWTSKAMVWLGEVSFAVYMVCIPWLLVCSKLASKVLNLPTDVMPPVVWLAMFVGVLPVAALAHHLVERPARAAMRGLEMRSNRRKDRVSLALRQA